MYIKNGVRGAQTSQAGCYTQNALPVSKFSLHFKDVKTETSKIKERHPLGKKNNVESS